MESAVAFGTHIAYIGFTITALAGKETFMKRVLFTLLVLGLFSTALIGCRAEGEIGDTQSNIGVAR